MRKYIEINNEKFKVVKPCSELKPYVSVMSLSDCYTKPSYNKCHIYNYWVNWASTTIYDSNYVVRKIQINSFNTHMFTLGADVYNKNDDFIGKLYITKTRQEFTPIA